MLPCHGKMISTSFSAETNSYVNTPEWVIMTEGSNLTDIFKHPAVDATRTVTNDIHEIKNILGIEAARQVLVNEITDIFEQSSSYVNFRHIALLSDVITHKGSFMSIDRHGINKSDIGPLAKCSFEETPDIIAKAAILESWTPLTVSPPTSCWDKEVPIGTGSVELLFDEERYSDLAADVELEEQEASQQQLRQHAQSSLAEDAEFLEHLCAPEMFEDTLFDNL